MDPSEPENRVLSTVSVIDSANEVKLGLGKGFDSTKRIRERQAILSTENLKAMRLAVGDTFNLHYDVGQMIKLFQSMSGGGGYDLFKLIQEDLNDKQVRDRLALELEKVFVN